MTTINRTFYGRGYFNFQIIKIIKHTIPVMSLLVDKCHNIEVDEKKSLQIVPYMAEYFSTQYTSRSNAIKRKRWSY